ncbi:ferredoxin [Saccharata proteae CBS 121410]|uniref:Ferredoxin n=1 Tax=Saccharata proteae CBS 121410 TaxID=1314787 RepID=A0A9P4HRH4_9PEZI|nr:ferredoxin [Saccharata proteae CBS 121410]
MSTTAAPTVRSLFTCLRSTRASRNLRPSPYRSLHTSSAFAAPRTQQRHGPQTAFSPSSSSLQTSFSRSRRRFSSTPISQHGHLTPPKAGEERKITFIDKEGDEHTFQVADGDNLLDIAQANDLEMEGACGGSCACSTCHVVVTDSDMYDRMPEPDDDENDMLDLAFGLTETSRLGCQVKMSKELDGLVVKLPTMTRNLQASDFAGKK